jgi:ribosome-associated protein
MRDVYLTTEPVELYKILKFEGLVSSGGIAKMVIDDGLVKVNGVVETRRRKKLVSGDVVEFEDEQLKLVLDANGKTED